MGKIHALVFILLVICFPECVNTQNSTVSEPAQSGLLTFDPSQLVLETSFITNTGIITMETKSVPTVATKIIQSELLTTNTLPVTLHSSSTLSVSIVTTNMSSASYIDELSQYVSRGTITELMSQHTSAVSEENSVSIMTDMSSHGNMASSYILPGEENLKESPIIYHQQQTSHTVEIISSVFNIEGSVTSSSMVGNFQGTSTNQQTTVLQTNPTTVSTQENMIQPSRTFSLSTIGGTTSDFYNSDIYSSTAVTDNKEETSTSLTQTMLTEVHLSSVVSSSTDRSQESSSDIVVMPVVSSIHSVLSVTSSDNIIQTSVPMDQGLSQFTSSVLSTFSQALIQQSVLQSSSITDNSLVETLVPRTSNDASDLILDSSSTLGFEQSVIPTTSISMSGIVSSGSSDMVHSSATVNTEVLNSASLTLVSSLYSSPLPVIISKEELSQLQSSVGDGVTSPFILQSSIGTELSQLQSSVGDGVTSPFILQSSIGTELSQLQSSVGDGVTSPFILQSSVNDPSELVFSSAVESLQHQSSVDGIVTSPLTSDFIPTDSSLVTIFSSESWVNSLTLSGVSDYMTIAVTEVLPDSTIDNRSTLVSASQATIDTLFSQINSDILNTLFSSPPSQPSIELSSSVSEPSLSSSLPEMRTSGDLASNSLDISMISSSGLDSTPLSIDVEITPSVSVIDITSVTGVIDLTSSVSGINITPSSGGITITPTVTFEGNTLNLISESSVVTEDKMTGTPSGISVTAFVSAVDVTASSLYVEATNVSIPESVLMEFSASSLPLVSDIQISESFVTSSFDLSSYALSAGESLQTVMTSMDLLTGNSSELLMTLVTMPTATEAVSSDRNEMSQVVITTQQLVSTYDNETASILSPSVAMGTTNLSLGDMSEYTDLQSIYMSSSIPLPSSPSVLVMPSENGTVSNLSYVSLNVSTTLMPSYLMSANDSALETHVIVTPSMTSVMATEPEVASGNYSSDFSLLITNMSTESMEMVKSDVSEIFPTMSNAQEMISSEYFNINSSDNVLPGTMSILPTISTSNTSDSVNIQSTEVPMTTQSSFVTESLLPSLPDLTVSVNGSDISMETSNVFLENSTLHVYNQSASFQASELINISFVDIVSEFSLPTITKSSPSLDLTTAPSVFLPSGLRNVSSIDLDYSTSQVAENFSLSILSTEMIIISSSEAGNISGSVSVGTMTAPLSGSIESSEFVEFSATSILTSQLTLEPVTNNITTGPMTSVELSSTDISSSSASDTFVIMTDSIVSTSISSSSEESIISASSSTVDVGTESMNITPSMDLTSNMSTIAQSSHNTTSTYSTSDIINSFQPSISSAFSIETTAIMTSHMYTQSLKVSTISLGFTVSSLITSQQDMTSSISTTSVPMPTPPVSVTPSELVTATQDSTSDVVIQTTMASILSLVTLNVTSEEMSTVLNMSTTEQTSVTNFVSNISESSMLPTSTVAMTTMNDSIVVKPTMELNISESIVPTTMMSATSDITSSPVVTTSLVPPTTTTTTTTTQPTTTPTPTTTTPAPTTTSSFVASYWIRTDLKVSLSINVTGDTFIMEMESNLAKAYNKALERQKQIAEGNYQPLKRRRRKRATKVGDTVVDIKDVTRKSGDVTVGYVVEKNGSVVLASEASTTLKLLSDQEMAILLGYVVTNRASGYNEVTTQTTTTPPQDTSGNYWIIGVAVGGIVLIIVIIWLTFCLVVKKKRSETEVDEKGAQPHLVRMKGPGGQENESVQEPGESSAGHKVKSTKRQSYEVTPEHGMLYESPVYAEAKKRGKNGPAHDRDTVTMETEKDGLIPSPSRKTKKKRRKKSADGFDTLEDGNLYETTRSVHPTSKMVAHPVMAPEPKYEEEEELQKKKEAERKKNKQRLREKRRKAREDTGDDDIMKQYLAAQEEIDNVLDAPPGEEKVQDVFKSKSKKGSKKKKKNSQKKKSEGNDNEGFDEEPLVEAKKRMHKLLDDAFALISPTGSVDGLTDEGNTWNKSSIQKFNDRNKVFPEENGVPKTDGTVPKENDLAPDNSGSEPGNKVYPKENGVPYTNGTVPRENGHVPDIFGTESWSDKEKAEKKHEPMYINPSFDSSERAGLTTWSPYRAADQVALISMPKTLQTPLENDAEGKVRGPRRPAAQLPLDSGLSKKYTSEAPKPLILRSREMKQEQTKNRKDKSYLRNGFGNHGESELDTLRSTYLGTDSRTGESKNTRKRQSMEMKNFNGDLMPQKSPPKHQAPSKRIKEGYDETDVISKTIHAGQTSDNTIKAVRGELQSALGTTVAVTGKGRQPSGSLVDIA